jgi:hypothetical protein
MRALKVSWGLPYSCRSSTFRARMKWLARAAQHVLFRAGVAIVCLALHLFAVSHFAAIHFGLPFNREPDQRPTYELANTLIGSAHWNRLVVSRWDSGHYIGMTIDGLYGHCEKADLRGADLRAVTSCEFAWFPGYPALAWLASLGNHYPADYALFGVALASSFVLLFLWTGPFVVKALGVWGAYCSLLLLNVFTTGFTLVTALSDPSTMLFIFCAVLCLEKRRFLLGAFMAGLASGMRITGLAAPVAYSCALLAWAWDQEDLTWKQWVTITPAVPLSAWGVLAMMGFEWWEYKDPFVYMHAHQATFFHAPKLANMVWPDAAWVVKSMSSGVHEVAFAAIMMLWFVLGHREGLRGFSRVAQVYWYVEFIFVLGVSLYGSADIAYAGMTRYLLLGFGAFFAMAGVLRNKPLALLAWCVISGWHYWNSDLCYFEQHSQPGGMDQCLVDVRDYPQSGMPGVLRFRGFAPPR